MQHPLVDPSLAPFGFVFPNSQRRLKFEPCTSTSINGERIIAKLWDKWNRKSSNYPLPVAEIVHRILPGLETSNRLKKGDFEFDGQRYLSRDILVLSGLIQWLATNVGNCFLEADISSDRDLPRRYQRQREFLIKRDLEKKSFSGIYDMPAFITHVCNAACGGSHMRPLQTCVYNRDDATPRDRAVVDGLLFWLGSNQGRAFIKRYLEKRKGAQEAAWKKAHEEMLARREAA